MPENAEPKTQEPEVKFHEIEEKLTCANGHTFVGKTAQLIPFISTNISLGEIIYVSPDDYGVYSGGGEKGQQINGYLVSCPECGLVHLTGFAVPVPDAVLAQGVNNTPTERALTV